MTFDDVATIRGRVRAGEAKAAVARDYDVSDVLIGKIARGDLWPDAESVARGGRHTEFGYALGRGEHEILVVGYVENVFYALPDVEFHETWATARANLIERSVNRRAA